MKRTIYTDAEAGDPYACLGVAYLYHTGKEVDQDLEEAFKWYKVAAGHGCPRAHLELSKIYYSGEIVRRNLAKYVEHLVDAAELGNAEAMMMLGNEFFIGDFIDRDYGQAFRWFNSAAENGDDKAKIMVGYLYAKGYGVDKSERRSESWFASAALTGSAELFLEIGLKFEFGMGGFEQDMTEAIRWYSLGCEMGYDKCVYCMNSISRSVRETFQQRVSALSQLSTQLETQARENAMQNGDNLFDEGDFAGAFDCYQEASDLGDPQATFNIAMMYHLGIHVRRNDFTSVDLLKRAAVSGCADAQFYLGMMYEEGRLPRDDNSSMKYFAMAAKNGFLPALYYLGRHMEHPEVYVRSLR